MSGLPSRLAVEHSREMVDGQRYYVLNEYFSPAYYDGEDWGIVVLMVAEVTEQETDFKPYRIAAISVTRPDLQNVGLLIDNKSVPCQYEKNFVVVCYNDESGNCYRARLDISDPRIACLFYRSDNKNRAELIDLWHQLNKEKNDHAVIFEAQ